MNKIIIITAMIMGMSTVAQADIVIKDWQLGMDKKQIKQVKKDNKICGKGKFSLKQTTGKSCNPVIKLALIDKMTLANQYVQFPKVDYVDGKAVMIYFELDFVEWDHFKGAFLHKYPEMTCVTESEELMGSMGVEFDSSAYGDFLDPLFDDTCTVTQGDQALTIKKYAYASIGGSVTIYSKSFIEESQNSYASKVLSDL